MILPNMIMSQTDQILNRSNEDDVLGKYYYYYCYYCYLLHLQSVVIGRRRKGLTRRQQHPTKIRPCRVLHQVLAI